MLGETLKRVHPDWQFHILLNDSLPGEHKLLDNVDVMAPIGGCDVDNFHGWCFGLSVVELCTATEAFFIRRLLDSGVKRAIYLDPDIAVVNSLKPIAAKLGNSDVLLTPHSFKPAVRDSEIYYSEMSHLAHGIFNLGFVAMSNSENASYVVDFWCRRMTNYCHDDHGRGLFYGPEVVQSGSIDVQGNEVLTDEGCNVASWNITHRPISKRNGDIYAGADLLRFFHFSRLRRARAEADVRDFPGDTIRSWSSCLHGIRVASGIMRKRPKR